MFKLRYDKRGMTLIEMIISLVILSILMSSTMGMIISSNNIFVSTSQAALDRLVGNSVYSTLESMLKYSTSLTISATPKNDNKQQSFMVSVSDNDTKSGKLMYRGKADDDGNASNYISLYDQSFYNNRTIQYRIVEAGKDQRHVDMQVRVYRNGKLVFSKDAIIKCLNLALIRSNSNQNTINMDKNASGADFYNQYLYFTVDELAIAGGDNAWAFEYKIQEYMDRYNAILNEYYQKLGIVNNYFNDPLMENKNEDGYRIQKDKLAELLNIRQLAIFGDGSGDSAWEGDEATGYKNLRAHYQEEIKKLLNFAPNTISDANNVYYQVVADKEELYTGFLLTYYDKNKDGKITKAEFPHEQDYEKFFGGTVMKKYANPSTNGIVNLTYFKDGLNDDYSRLFTTDQRDIWFYTTIGDVYDPDDKHYVSTRPEVFGGEANKYYSYANGDINGASSSSASLKGPAFSIRSKTGTGGGFSSKNVNYTTVTSPTNTTPGTYDYKLGGLSSNWKETYRNIFAVMGDNLIESTSNTYNLFKVKETKKDVKVNNDSCTEIILEANTDIPEGWYYCRQETNLSEAKHFFYLEAAGNAATNVSGKKIAMKQGCQVHIFSFNYSVRYFYYDQAQYNPSESFDASTQKITNYTINRHQYNDYFIYGVDWNSWYKATQDGLLNKVIGGLSNLFTHRTDINQITATNADQVLGLKGRYTVDNIDRSLRSYNLAWIVYSPKRSTWYYLPDSSTRISSALSGVSWISNKNTPVPLDITGWSSSTAMVKDIETRKLSSRGFFNLIDTTEDKIWVPLPTGSTIDRTSVTE